MEASTTLAEEFVLSERGDLEIGLYVGHSKNEDSFKETPIDRLKSRLEVLLNFDSDTQALAAVKPELAEFFHNSKSSMSR